MLDSYRIDLPAVWTAIPITTGRDFQDRFVEFRDPSWWAAVGPTDRRRVELTMQRIDAQLRAGECNLAALYVQRWEEREAESNEEAVSELPLLATATISTLKADDLGAPGSVTVALLQAAMAQPSPGSRDELLEPPSVIQLEVGPGVRVVRLVDLGDAGATKVFNHAVMVPIEPENDRVCVLSFMTPNVDMARDFETLFDAIAQTLKFYREGDPTEL